MLLRLVSFGLAAATLSIAGAAFADNAVTMESTQTNIITGNNNKSVNSSIQDYSKEGYRRANTGTSMRNSQTNDIQGDDNTSININNQGKKVRSNYRR
jgi:hypothetical protein